MAPRPAASRRPDPLIPAVRIVICGGRHVKRRFFFFFFRMGVKRVPALANRRNAKAPGHRLLLVVPGWAAPAWALQPYNRPVTIYGRASSQIGQHPNSLGHAQSYGPSTLPLPQTATHPLEVGNFSGPFLNKKKI